MPSPVRRRRENRLASFAVKFSWYALFSRVLFKKFALAWVHPGTIRLHGPQFAVLVDTVRRLTGVDALPRTAALGAADALLAFRNRQDALKINPTRMATVLVRGHLTFPDPLKAREPQPEWPRPRVSS